MLSNATSQCEQKSVLRLQEQLMEDFLRTSWASSPVERGTPNVPLPRGNTEAHRNSSHTGNSCMILLMGTYVWYYWWERIYNVIDGNVCTILLLGSYAHLPLLGSYVRLLLLGNYIWLPLWEVTVSIARKLCTVSTAVNLNATKLHMVQILLLGSCTRILYKHCSLYVIYRL